MRLFAKLRKHLSKYLDKKQIELIHQAFLFAADAHKEQTRSSGEPYITHPVTVACILADMHMDPETIMAALMHDVMEDTNIDKSTIAEKFGDAVAMLIDGVSKLTQIKFENKAEAQAENFRKMILAMAKDIRVILVKLADRLHNMRTLASLRPDKRRRIARETMDIYVPIAKRLGMHTLRIELENLCFQAIHPERFRIIEKAVEQARGNRKGVITVIEKAIKTKLGTGKIKLCSVTGREKHLYSIYRKMKTKRLPLSDIMDVYAFRIILEDADDCYRVLGLMHNLYKPVPERFKDYIAIPKANGYQSLHTTLFGPYGVPLEIQIRSEKMDATAEKGIAAHWLYKQGKKNRLHTDKRTQAWLERLLEIQRSAASTMEFVENVKFDLFPDEVYVFTPSGDIVELPRGATIVDFAYAVHSDVGNRCVAGKVDRRFAPLSTSLSNGQTVEIITAENTTPKPAWLDFVVTGKARGNIKHYMKHQQRSESVNLGNALLGNALQELSVKLTQLPKENVARVLNESNFKDVDEMYSAVGRGYYSPVLLAKRLTGNIDENIEVISSLSEPVAIRGVEGMMMHFGKCCHPIPGDAIIGYIESERGMIVHAVNCRHVADFADEPQKYIPLSWDERVQGDFDVSVGLQLKNSRGVLAELANKLAESNVNIQDVRVLEKSSEYSTVSILLSVQNRSQLADAMRNLRKIKSVVKINREKK
tara:strand:+ start:92765 stop:94882 length:2118 start_codon:yes stop_codon:yes gene_type:complete